jgi:hypothetical protein
VSFAIDLGKDFCDLSTENELSAVQLERSRIVFPKESILLPPVPEVIQNNIEHKTLQEDFPKITHFFVGFEKRVFVINSLKKPKCISIVGSDSNMY